VAVRLPRLVGTKVFRPPNQLSIKYQSACNQLSNCGLTRMQQTPQPSTSSAIKFAILPLVSLRQKADKVFPNRLSINFRIADSRMQQTPQPSTSSAIKFAILRLVSLRQKAYKGTAVWIWCAVETRKCFRTRRYSDQSRTKMEMLRPLKVCC
jgi:hypothetical protein